ncbi:MAG: TlpA family protein disulfide reductase [Calditrichota bacterium]
MKRLLLIAVAAFMLQTLCGEAYADSRDWSLLDMDGNTFRLASVRGDGPVLLMFWATWCIPCKREFAKHEDLLNDYVKKGVHVILVSEDNSRTQARVKPFIEAKKYKWPVLLDPDGAVLKRYGGTTLLPYTVLLDQNGATAKTILGELKKTDVLTAEIDKLLGADGE